MVGSIPSSIASKSEIDWCSSAHIARSVVGADVGSTASITTGHKAGSVTALRIVQTDP